MGMRTPGSPRVRSTTQACRASGKNARTTLAGAPSEGKSCGPRTWNGFQWSAWMMRSRSSGEVVGMRCVFKDIVLGPPSQSGRRRDRAPVRIMHYASHLQRPCPAHALHPTSMGPPAARRAIRSRLNALPASASGRPGPVCRLVGDLDHIDRRPLGQVLRAPGEVGQVDPVHRRAHADHGREEVDRLVRVLGREPVDQVQLGADRPGRARRGPRPRS